MSILLITPNRYDRYRNELNQMYQLRYEIFHKRLGWDVKIENGIEKDEYDEINAYYMLYLHKGKVVCTSRYIETTDACMFDGSFSFLKPFINQAKGQWELSRVCIADGYLLRDILPLFHRTYQRLRSKLGVVNELYAITYPAIQKLYKRYGWEFKIVTQSRINNETIVLASDLLEERI